MSETAFNPEKRLAVFPPELRDGQGSAPAPGAVFRALAENLVRIKKSAGCAWVRATEWLDARW